MKAAYIENGEVRSGVLPDPVPGPGQVLVRTHRCGLCASDLHFLKGGRNVIKLSKKLGGPYAMLDFDKPFVPGHEYVGEVLESGYVRRGVRECPGRGHLFHPVHPEPGQ